MKKNENANMIILMMVSLAAGFALSATFVTKNHVYFPSLILLILAGAYWLGNRLLPLE